MEKIKTGYYKEVVDGVNFYIDAPNKTEAKKILDARIHNRNKPLSKEAIKEAKILSIKNEAKQKIEAIEWKVSRHLQQRELGINTSLTNDEFIILLTDIQEIRDWSNEKENEL